MIKHKPDIYRPVTQEMKNSPYLRIFFKDNVQQEDARWFGKYVFFRSKTLNLKGKRTLKGRFKKLEVKRDY